MDGARLFNAAAAAGAAGDVSTIVANVDTISVCLSKGIGAPVGSVLVGPAAFIARARRCVWWGDSSETASPQRAVGSAQIVAASVVCASSPSRRLRKAVGGGMRQAGVIAAAAQAALEEQLPKLVKGEPSLSVVRWSG
jgi:threonine aldolase